MLYYICLRVDKVTEDTLPLFLDFIKTLKDKVSSIISEEVADKSKKIHYHCQLEIESKIKCDSYMSNLRRSLNKSVKVFGSEFYVKKNIKKVEAHVTYMIKDLKLIEDSWVDREFIENCTKETIRINKEKDTKMKHQLLKYIDGLYEWETNTIAIDVNDVMVDIIDYHVTRDYLPPSRTLLTQYASYCVSKLCNCKSAGKVLIMQIYNFRV